MVKNLMALLSLSLAALFPLACNMDGDAEEEEGLTMPSSNIPTGPTGTFLQVGDMLTPRKNHGAVKMVTGDVLIVGGENSAGQTLTTAEIYQYNQGVFLAAPFDMNLGRRHFSTATLADNRILIMGGDNGMSAALNKVELFDPSSYTFTYTTGDMTTARTGHASLTLNNGNVLICGGTDASGNVLASCEVFDHTTGTFTATTNPMATARTGHSMTLLRNGKVLIAGGVGAGGTVVNSAELYDPQGALGETGTFTATGNLSAARAGHVARIINVGGYEGHVVLFGGYTGTSASPLALSTADVFDPDDNGFAGAFTQVQTLMETTRNGLTATILSGGTKMLVVGGGAINRPEIFDPYVGSTGTGAAMDGDFVRTRDAQPADTAMTAITINRIHHGAAFLPNGTILICGGQDGAAVTDSAEIYNP